MSEKVDVKIFSPEQIAKFRSKMVEMFLLQNTANEYASGIDWKTGLTENGSAIDWLRAARYELVEAVDQSVQWKWWKSIAEHKHFAMKDSHNFKIELVDTWHFLMSQYIIQNAEDHIVNLVTPDFFARVIPIDGEQLVNMTDNVQVSTTPHGISNFGYLEQFFTLVGSVMTFQEFYEVYIMKNVLNIFRQKNGYKDGSYIKEWGEDKREDNEFLADYAESEEEICFDNIMTFLEEKYKTLNNL